MLKGKIIAIEGPDFSGKTTLIKNLIHLYYGENIESKVYIQPGATPLGMQCRRLLFNNPEVPEMDNLSERLFFAIDHVELTNVLKKHKEENNKLIFCDRWSPMSNFVYGYQGRQLEYDKMIRLNDFIYNGTEPDLIIIIDLTIEECLKRYKEAKGREINKLDKQGIAFKQRILDGYNIVKSSDLRSDGKVNIVHINGCQSELKVLEDAFDTINEFLV